MANEYSVKDLIDLVARKYKFNYALDAERVKAAYNYVVGELICKLTRSVNFVAKSGTLYVSIASPALRHEMNLKKSDLMAAINSRLNTPIVKELILK